MTGPVLVIGGTGFIGAAVARAAVAAGRRVVVTGHDVPGGPALPDLPDGVGHTVLDVTDRAAVDAVLADTRPDAIVHLAAFGVGASGLAAGARHRPALAVDVNIRGLANVIESAAAHGVRRLCWSSSSTVYGPAAGRGTVDEDAALTPDLVYGATKVGAEQLARVLAADLGLPVAGIRLPLVYGPGRWYGGSQETLVRFLADLVAGRPARIEAWTGTADWIHVDDAAASLLAGIETDPPSPLYNVVGHRGGLAELVRAIVAASSTGRADATVVEIPDGAPDLPLMDDRRIRAELGFSPRYGTAASGAADYAARLSPDTEEDQ